MKKGKKESGNKILFIRIISNNSFFTLKGRYSNNVGAEKIIAIP
jgi:hypothetical protein